MMEERIKLEYGEPVAKVQRLNGHINSEGTIHQSYQMDLGLVKFDDMEMESSESMTVPINYSGVGLNQYVEGGTPSSSGLPQHSEHADPHPHHSHTLSSVPPLADDGPVAFKSPPKKRRNRKPANQKFTCPECLKKYPEVAQLISHLTRYHQKTDRLFCELCADSFPDHFGKEMHETHQHGPGLLCKFCPTSYKNEPALQIHLQRMHFRNLTAADLDFRHEKPITPTATSTSSASATGSSTSPGKKRKREEELRHYCPECNKSFDSPRRLSGHITWHKKALVCSECKETFENKQSLTDHWKINHNLWKCHVCQEIMKEEISLKTHLGQVHSLRARCSWCNVWLEDATQLAIHAREKHPEQKTGCFKCDVCEKVFLKRAVLKGHLKQVHKLTEMQPVDSLNSFQGSVNVVVAAPVEGGEGGMQLVGQDVVGQAWQQQQGDNQFGMKDEPLASFDFDDLIKVPISTVTEEGGVKNDIPESVFAFSGESEFLGEEVEVEADCK